MVEKMSVRQNMFNSSFLQFFQPFINELIQNDARWLAHINVYQLFAYSNHSKTIKNILSMLSHEKLKITWIQLKV